MRSTSARASPTRTARPRCSRPPATPSRTASTSTRPAAASRICRQAIAEHQQRFYGLQLDPDREVLVTAGATEAIAATLLALLDGPGDEVVVFEPYYDAYAAVRRPRRRDACAPCRCAGRTSSPTSSELADAVTDRTRIILVNDPHNPTGAVFAREVLDEVVRLAHRHDAIIVTDEVYEHLTFGVPHMPIATLPGAWERTITISSGGQDVLHHRVEDRLGHAAPPIWSTPSWPSSSSSPTSTGRRSSRRSPPACGSADDFFDGIAADPRGTSATCSATGSRAAGFDVSVPDGSLLRRGGCRAPSARRMPAEFCRALPERAGVVAIPLTAFVTPARRAEYATLVRFAACKRVEVLEEAASRLARSEPLRLRRLPAVSAARRRSGAAAAPG